MMSESRPSRLKHTDWNQLSAVLNWAMEARERGSTQSRGDSLWYSAFWLKQGMIRILADKQEIRLKPGEWVFLQPGRRIIDKLAGTVYVAVGFQLQWRGEGEMVPPRQNSLLKSENLPILEQKTIRLYEQMYTEEGVGHPWIRIQYKKTSSPEHFQLRYLFYDWLRSWISVMEESAVDWCHIRNVDRRMVNAIQIMEDLSFDVPLNLKELADSAGLSVYRFLSLFDQQYGMTPRAWRERLRMQSAIHKLQETVEPIKEVAASLGLSAAHFAVWMKQKTGFRPIDLRLNGKN